MEVLDEVLAAVDAPLDEVADLGVVARADDVVGLRRERVAGREALSAASRALTVKVYEVEGDRPPMVAVVVVVVPETVAAGSPPR